VSLLSLVYRKAITAKKLFRESGVEGVVDAANALRERIQTRYLRSVDIHGCRVDISSLGDCDMRYRLAHDTYETDELQLIEKWLPCDLPVIELGACLGVVSCVVNRRLKRPADHFVVEPNPQMFAALERNRRINKASFIPLPRAIAYGRPTVTFSPDPDPWANNLSLRGDHAVTVQTTTLHEIVQLSGFDRFTLICDIEGHECEVINNELDTLRLADMIIMETHRCFVGDRRTSEMLAMLSQAGFGHVDQSNSVVVLTQIKRLG
jgi:FkbM family methyltransferase